MTKVSFAKSGGITADRPPNQNITDCVNKVSILLRQPVYNGHLGLTYSLYSTLKGDTHIKI